MNKPKTAPTALFGSASAARWAGPVILAAFFLCGAVAGCLTAARAAAPADDALYAGLRDYLSLLTRPETGRLLGHAFLGAFAYHLAVFFLGLTLFGVAFIPLTLAARGFFLSFAVTAFARVFGSSGLLLALGAFGGPTLLTLPCLLALGQAGLSSSWALLGAARGLSPKPAFTAAYVFRFVLFAAVLALAALFETFVAPPLVSWLAGRLI
ncbi:MAG: stage II sporulation protein M [Oscillospiraceae bacterium]|nr:stage II sporulation protein M [Oscillospiraceae bacterium]